MAEVYARPPCELGDSAVRPKTCVTFWPEPKAQAKEKDEVEDAASRCRVLSAHDLAASRAGCNRAELDRNARPPAVREHHYAEDEK
jgi:hypothetical protein